MKSSDIHVADAQVESFSYSKGCLTVRIRTDGGAFEIMFHTVLGVETVSPEGQDLSHISESVGDPYLSDVCKKAEEPEDGFKKFSFISAWTDEPLLTVIAVDAKIRTYANPIRTDGLRNA